MEYVSQHNIRDGDGKGMHAAVKQCCYLKFAVHTQLAYNFSLDFPCISNICGLRVLEIIAPRRNQDSPVQPLIWQFVMLKSFLCYSPNGRGQEFVHYKYDRIRTPHRNIRESTSICGAF